VYLFVYATGFALGPSDAQAPSGSLKD